ncbi:MAG TPA: carboxypeptidase regulatory-like domain-containing protein [Bryobacteraceae bacterium]|jgi:plastocyanin
MKKIWIGAGVVCAMTLVGCGGSTPPETAKAPDAAAAPAGGGGAGVPDEANGATITGKVTFDGAKPSAKPIDMSANPVCMRAHASSPQKPEDVVVNDNGTLKYVFVWVKSGLPDKTWQVPTTPVTLDQNGCMYKPHVFGVMAGQKIAVKNSDPTNHNIHPQPQTNQEWNESQPPGSADKLQSFPRQEVMIPVKCNIHPWMRAYIGVVAHPFYAVTGDDGTFTIKGLPPGTYTIEAWHEKFGKSEQTVTVGAKDSKTQDFAFKG